MNKFILLIFAMMVLFGCGSGGGTNAALQTNTVKPTPTIKVTNIIPNAGTGHLAGKELTLLGFTVENTDPYMGHQILRNVTWDLHDSSNKLIDSYSSETCCTVDAFGMPPGETFVNQYFSAKMFKTEAFGEFTLNVYATDADGVKSNIVTTKINL